MGSDLFKKINKSPTFKRVYKKVKAIKWYEIAILLCIGIVVIFILLNLRSVKKSERTRIAAKIQGKNWADDYSNGDGFKPPLWVTTDINKNDVELSLSGEEIAIVESIDKYDDNGTVLLILSLKTSLDPATKQLQFKNRALLVGGTLELIINNTLSPAEIIDLNPPVGGYQKATYIVTAKARLLEDIIAKQIKIGDKAYNLGTNEVIAEVMDVKVSQSTNDITFNGTNIHFNTNLKEVDLKLKIQAQKIKNSWYFATEQKVKAGHHLYVAFPNYNIGWLIIDDVQSADE